MTAPLRELADAGLCETARLIAELVRRVEGLEAAAKAVQSKHQPERNSAEALRTGTQIWNGQLPAFSNRMNLP